MKAILTYTLFLIGTFAFSYMLIISADGESQIQDNREKAYLEHIERESLKWKKQLHLMQLAETVYTLRF